MMITLQAFKGETEAAVQLIQGFWEEHNHYRQSTDEAMADLNSWTTEGHRFYFIMLEEKYVGFLHLGSRGGEADWLEDLYVEGQYQNRGIGTRAIQLVEEIVKEYSESMYIEAAARNERAIRLYRRMGYDCLNTITVRKDFQPENHEVIRQEHIYGQQFEVKRYKEQARIPT